MRGRHPLSVALVAAVALVVLTSFFLAPIGGLAAASQPQTQSTIALGDQLLGGGSIHVGSYPAGVAFDSGNGLLYVTNFGSNNISVVNTTTNQIMAWIPMPFGIDTLAVDTSTGLVYVADSVSTVYAINSSTNRVEWTISLQNAGCPHGCGPDVQTFDPANGDIYVTDIATDNVSVIRGNLPVATVPVGVDPNGATYDSANGEVFVSNEGATIPANLTVIDGTTNRVVGQVYPSGNGPGVAYASSNGDVYTCTNGIQNGFSNLVSVANGTTNKVVVSIPITSSCGAAVYDPVNDYVYVTDRTNPGGRDQFNVTLIDTDTNRIVLTQPAQMGPIGIAYDSANHNIYVADSDTNNISILPQVYRLTVHETGLSPGTNWSATVGGTTFSSTIPTITFPETNGTFDFAIGNETNLSANPSSGTLTVSGGPRMLNVTFSKGGGSSSGLFGLPGATGYYVLGGVVALLVAVVVVVIALARRKRRTKASSTTLPPDGASGQNR